MKELRAKGSITIFAALSIMLVAQLLFTLLEGARNIEIRKCLQMDADSVLESMFADYVTPLWENYRLLGMAVNNREGAFSTANREASVRNLSRENLMHSAQLALFSGSSLLTAEVKDVEFANYLLMTDQQGRVFQSAAVAYMRRNAGYEAVQAIRDGYESVQDVQADYGNADEAIGNALDALEEGTAPETVQPEEAKPEENLLTTVAGTQRTGILTLVFPEGEDVSGARINLQDAVSHRALQQGTKEEHVERNWYDKLLFKQYLLRYLSACTDKRTDRGLNYELEYLIGGRADDASNLRIALTELLAAREALNLAAVAGMPDKQARAQALATMLAGATANPAVIEAIKWGLLAAWAYAESVLDLRTLLQGGKIVLSKTEADWTSDLEDIPVLLSNKSCARSGPGGLSYKEYLGTLLFFHSEKTLAMRAMDMEEAAVRKMPGYGAFQMDHLICETDLLITYAYHPVFLGFVSLLNRQRTKDFGTLKKSHYSYMSTRAGV